MDFHTMDFRGEPAGSYLCQAVQVNPQFLHVVGLRPASSESNPIGKKQMLTMIAHVG
jgi:hypothetical protein